MEKLYKIGKNDVFPMLITLLQIIFKYMDFMTHCDIKPDNIMKTRDNKYYFIDYEDICNQKLLYGYNRRTFTPLFATQSSIVNPVLITAKNDIIELIISCHYIYYNEEKQHNVKSNVKYLVSDTDKYSRDDRIFATMYLFALNIDERSITDKDEYLLLYIIELVYNFEIIKKDTEKSYKKLNELYIY